MNDKGTALSVFRNEKKYLISCQDAMSLRNRLDCILVRDGHSAASGYMVRSLYFDSPNNIDYTTKLAGTEVRKKIRIRIYAADAKKCKLEIKQKNGDLQHKVSLWITRNDAEELIKGNYTCRQSGSGGGETCHICCYYSISARHAEGFSTI